MADLIRGSRSLQPATTAPLSQPAKPVNWWDAIGGTIASTANNLVRGTISTGQKALNTAAAGVTGLETLGQAGLDKLTNNASYQANLNANASKLRDYLTRKTVTGDQGAFITLPQAQNANHDIVGNFIKPVLATAGEVAPMVLPYGAISKAAAPVEGAVASKITTGLLGNVAGKAARYGTEASIVAPVSAGISALHQYGTTGTFDPTEALKTGLQAGVFTGAGGLAGDIAQPVISKIASIPNEIRTNALHQATETVQPQLLPTSSLTSYEGAPDRVQVDTYKQQIKSGKQLDPLIAMHDSQGNLGIEDGKHRLQAYKELGISNVPVKIAEPQNVQAALQTGSVMLPFGKKSETLKNDLPIIGPDLGAVKPKSRFANITAPESGNLSTELSKSVKENAPTYEATTNVKRLSQSVNDITSKGIDNFSNEVHTRLNDAPLGKINDQTVADALTSAAALDVRGDTKSLQQATDIYDKLSEHLTKAGQTVQAASIIKRRTPQGLLFSGQRALKQAGVEVTPDLQGKLRAAADDVAKAAPGNKDRAIAKMQKLVQDSTPAGKLDNLVGTWKAGLLSGVKTQGGNFLSNATFGTLKSASDPLAAGIDKVLSAFTKKRTIGLTGKGIMSGTKEGFQKGFNTLKTGIDERNVSASGKYEQHAEINFKNKAVQAVFGKPANLVFRSMNAADQPFYYAALKNSLHDQAKADGLTKGLKGQQLRDHIDNTVQNPNGQLMQRAVDDANKSVLGFDTIASKAVSGIHQAIENMKGVSSQGKSIANAVVNVLAPFTKVPSAFLTRAIDFTPLGVGKEAFSQIFNKKFDQRGLSKAIAEGATGTGLIAMGMALSNSGQLSGDYPSDPKEQARWKAEGITQNSVKLGGKWYSMNYLGPVGLLFGIGNNMVKSAQGGAGVPEQVGKGIAGLGSGLLNQSFVQGLTGFTDAIKDPARNLSTFVNSQAASIIPSWLNDIANATDTYQRQASNPGEAIQGRIPGLREGLTPKFDAFGNDLTQPTGSGFETAVNPLKPSNNIDNTILSETNRLKDTGNAVFPTPSKAIGTGNNKLALTVPQQSERQKLVGNMLSPLWGKIIASPDYQKMDDAHKANALQSALTDVNTAADRTILSKYKPEALNGQAKGRVINVLDNSITAQDYLKTKTTSQKSSADKYKAAQDKYLKDKTSGKLSDIQDYKAQQNLKKEAITSKYPADVVQFYGLSKSQQNAFFASNKDAATKLYNQAKQMESELISSGIVQSSKFKAPVGTRVPRGRKTASTGSGKKVSSGGKYNYSKGLSSIRAPKGTLRNLLGKSTIKLKKIKGPKAKV